MRGSNDLCDQVNVCLNKLGAFLKPRKDHIPGRRHVILHSLSFTQGSSKYLIFQGIILITNLINHLKWKYILKRQWIPESTPSGVCTVPFKSLGSVRFEFKHFWKVCIYIYTYKSYNMLLLSLLIDLMHPCWIKS